MLAGILFAHRIEYVDFYVSAIFPKLPNLNSAPMLNYGRLSHALYNDTL